MVRRQTGWLCEQTVRADSPIMCAGVATFLVGVRDGHEGSPSCGQHLPAAVRRIAAAAGGTPVAVVPIAYHEQPAPAAGSG